MSYRGCGATGENRAAHGWHSGLSTQQIPIAAGVIETLPGRHGRIGLCRPINGALCFRYRLGLRRGSASFRMVSVERDRPFPDMPLDTLNDAVLDREAVSGLYS